MSVGVERHLSSPVPWYLLFLDFRTISNQPGLEGVSGTMMKNQSTRHIGDKSGAEGPRGRLGLPQRLEMVCRDGRGGHWGLQFSYWLDSVPI